MTLPVLSAVTVDEIKQYKSASDKIIFSQNFDGIKKWRRLPGNTLVPAEGANGTTGLKVDRSKKTPFRVSYSAALPKLVPGSRYEVSFMVKSKDVTRVSGKYRLTVGGIEFTRNGNVMKLEYPTYEPSDDYKEMKFSFLAPENMDCQISLDLSNQFSGIVWFDDVVIRAAGVDYSSRLIWPQNLTFRGGESDFKVHINDETPDHCVVYVKLEQEGNTQELLLKRHELTGKFAKLLTGKGKLTISIVDPKEKLILSSNTYSVNVLDAAVAPPANAVTIDRYGRMVVDGKPFMPFGVYGLFHEDSLKRISEASFNCVLVYPSFSMFYGKKTGDRIADIRAGLDRFSAHGLKILFAMNQQFPGYSGITELGDSKGLLNVAVRAVNEFKDHPALLGWYLSDEVSRHTIPHVQNLREHVNAADPWHPTYTITYRMPDLPYYGVSGDIIGVDPYPVKPLQEKSNLDPIITYMKGAQSTGMPIWAIPQIFNWAIYDKELKKPEKFATTRGPNEKEMLAMPLLCAIMGAKGFIFYSEMGITFWAEKIQPGITEKEWPKVERMAKEMKRLEPYILGIEKAPEVKVSGTDRVMAKAFKAENGKIAVFIVALGPDPVKAEISIDLPAGKTLKSRFGLTTGSNGKYTFAAGEVDSDILEEAE